jgi:hypothetical protein
VASPAGADSSTAAVIKNCSKTRHGVTVRIKLRDDGRHTRIRFSHPDGTGNFYAPKVTRVLASINFWQGDQAAHLAPYRTVGPSVRVHTAQSNSGDDFLNTVAVHAIFKLRSGKHISLGCHVDG